MSKRSSSARAAVHLHRLTKWSEATCRDLVRRFAPDQVEAIAEQKGRTIDKTSEEYARWRKRAEFTQRAHHRA
jgi:hypothetical protein